VLLRVKDTLNGSYIVQLNQLPASDSWLLDWTVAESPTWLPLYIDFTANASALLLNNDIALTSAIGIRTAAAGRIDFGPYAATTVLAWGGSIDIHARTGFVVGPVRVHIRAQ
jgi:hypothetical protein